jgi:signal transduction histidine kinase
MFRSIRWRLILSYVILALFTIIVVGVLTLEIIEQHALRQERENLLTNARGLTQQTLPLLWPVVRQDELSQLVETASFLGHLQVRILDVHRATIVDSGDPRDGSLLVFLKVPERFELLSETYPRVRVPMIAKPNLFIMDHEQAEAVLAEVPSGVSVSVIRREFDPWGGRFTFQDMQAMDEKPVAITTAEANWSYSKTTILEPIIRDQRLFGYVELSAAPDYGAEELGAVREALVYAGGGAVLLAAIIGLLSSYRLTSPLHKLTETATRMGSGDLSARAPIRARDEIGTLATQFNTMAEQLEGSFKQLASERDALRRFISDASHELRTPITALKSFNTLLLDSAAEDPAARAEFLTESQAQLERLEWITRNLLDLSRLEAGLLQLDLADHPLADLLASAIAVSALRMKEKGLVFSMQPVDPAIQLHCDRARMDLAISNLLDNALKFTSQGGHVEVGAGKEQESINIWVKDTGIGIPEEDLPHVFERFYRGDNHREAGSGLGLSIVESIIKAHGGAISVESKLGAGTRFTLKLPLHGEMEQDDPRDHHPR